MKPQAPESPIIGLQAIAEYVFLSLGTVKKYSTEWQKQGILIRRTVGRPPNRKTIVLSYPSLLQKVGNR